MAAPLEHSHSHSPSRSSDNIVPSSPSTTVTTPDQSPGADDEIWDTSSDHEHPRNDPTAAPENDANHDALSPRRPTQILSDLPTLRRQHVTSGYREGLAIGKAQVMQRGFDDGYPFGTELGLRVGAVLGVLEGMLVVFKKANSASGSSGTAQTVRRGRPEISTSRNSPPSPPPPSNLSQTTARGASQASRPTTSEQALAFLSSLYTRAAEELKISNLMKAMDDEKVAKLEAGDGLPLEIEQVVRRWEELVLGNTFGGSSSLGGLNKNAEESKTLEQDGSLEQAVP